MSRHNKRHGENVLRPSKDGKVSHVQAEQPLSRDIDGSLRVRMDLLNPPQNVYDADGASLTLRHGTVSFLFGKADPINETRLRTRLEVRYPVEAFADHFILNSREFHSALVQQMETAEVPVLQHTPLEPATMPAEREHSLWANFDFIARTGSQASIDFFHLPPADIARFVKNDSVSGLRIEPVLRVLTTVDVLRSLLDAAADVLDQARSQTGALIGKRLLALQEESPS